MGSHARLALGVASDAATQDFLPGSPGKREPATCHSLNPFYWGCQRGYPGVVGCRSACLGLSVHGGARDLMGAQAVSGKVSYGAVSVRDFLWSPFASLSSFFHVSRSSLRLFASTHLSYN